MELNYVRNVCANLLAKLLRQLVRGAGVLPRDVYRFLAAVAPICCVDAIPIRSRGGRWQVGLIRRNTGFYTGKLFFVGGRVMFGEHIERALRRHVLETLGGGMEFFSGLSWDHPFLIAQYKPMGLPEDGFTHEPSKHSIGLTYLIRLTDRGVTMGRTSYGGQEASELLWFFLDEIPPPEQFAYGGHPTAEKIIAHLENLSREGENR